MSAFGKVGPYEAISHDFVRSDGYRILLSGAYNASGLIGSEYNGIVVLDEEAKQVVTSCVGRKNSGWYGENGGPSSEQVRLFNTLKSAGPVEFAALVNDLGSARARVVIEPRAEAFSREVEARIEEVGTNAAMIAIRDKLSDLAEERRIPEGDERDAWIIETMSDNGIHDGLGPKEMSVVMAKIGIHATEIREENDDPTPM